ncbi:MAG: cob(I)yrinic acid a,c-diamide adenosyltransferase [Deltaproteobacteria bacterium]|nr:cob(I)yrinic acid a,c-diamide adenosyltransferase [Deltaproteobacteria bacterium]
MKIYTGSGDRGRTSLFSGERIAKNNPRIEAYGGVDELNSCLGALTAALSERRQSIAEIRQIQSDLFHIGACLATTPGSPATAALEPFDQTRCRYLETAIDHMEQHLPPLNGFILPGGRMPAALAHVARTVCRRAERHVVGLAESQPDDRVPEVYRTVLVYLNRLSDYLFVFARYCNHLAGEADLHWK